MALKVVIIWEHYLYIDNPKDFTDKQQELINEFLRINGYKINKNQLYLHILATSS